MEADASGVLLYVYIYIYMCVCYVRVVFCFGRRGLVPFNQFTLVGCSDWHGSLDLNRWCLGFGLPGKWVPRGFSEVRTWSPEMAQNETIGGANRQALAHVSTYRSGNPFWKSGFLSHGRMKSTHIQPQSCLTPYLSWQTEALLIGFINGPNTRFPSHVPFRNFQKWRVQGNHQSFFFVLAKSSSTV